ncbi:YciI family protein [Virgibacillus soli]|uniref:YciI family protein n=1 Tax=Paracerasibacillus soli TaxID=480284 RepID=A0ABU5CT93_9BACI|nr:YciI family protein [Virgibacillus soli]MDY0409091.1 YciI family protein [Virgibacillus soli]
MKYFAVFLTMKDEEKNKQFRADHLQFLDEQMKQGTVFAKGPFMDGSGGLVVYQVDNISTAEKLVKLDPYVINGAREYEIREWKMEVGKGE